MTRTASESASRNRFGTFGGVFTPAILTILGVIMFMRANFVVGQAGIIGAVLILLVAKSITFLTSLSIAAVSTNMQVRGGGSYFLISRVLGAESGGAIGIALFCALALSVPFYILGFAEALVLSYPVLTPYFMVITLLTAGVLFAIAYLGAGWAIRAQYLIMFFLFLAIFSFMGGALLRFSPEIFQANLASGYTSLLGGAEGERYSFWIIFAIYFPAVTGIDAGLNMSGDLKDPSRSIPRGTMAAVVFGFCVYLAQILLDGGAYPRQALIDQPYGTLQQGALWGWPVVVVLGVVAATLSSALSSYLGAPRVLQAVSRDRLLWFLSYFGRGSRIGDEPRRGLVFTMLITLSVLLWSGNESGGAALNAVASIITMFFLYSYGMINLAAFTEDFADNPSFRPAFKYFHWSASLLGFLACLAVSFLVNWQASLAAVLLISVLLYYLKSRHLRSAFGDARRGFVFQKARNNLLKLRLMPDDPKNWRPTILAFSGTPEMRQELVSYAVWFEARRGLVYLAYVLAGDFAELAPRRSSAIQQLTSFCAEHDLEAFPVVVVAPKVEQGIAMLLQSSFTGPLHPNMSVMGWSSNIDQLQSYVANLKTAAQLGMSNVLCRIKGLPEPGAAKRIDVWWRGQKNGGLMMLLAYLLSTNWEWQGVEIRVLRVIGNEEGREPAGEDLSGLLQKARVEAGVKIIVSDEAFIEVFGRESADATCVFIGFDLPAAGQETTWHAEYKRLLAVTGTVIMVNSGGEGELLT